MTPETAGSTGQDRVTDSAATPALDDFLARYREDDNEWWMLSSGDHQNLFDAAVQRIEELSHRLSAREFGEVGS